MLTVLKYEKQIYCSRNTYLNNISGAEKTDTMVKWTRRWIKWIDTMVKWTWGRIKWSDTTIKWTRRWIKWSDTTIKWTRRWIKWSDTMIKWTRGWIKWTVSNLKNKLPEKTWICKLNCVIVFVFRVSCSREYPFLPPLNLFKIWCWCSGRKDRKGCNGRLRNAQNNW